MPKTLITICQGVIMGITARRVVGLCVILFIVSQAWTHRHLVTQSHFIPAAARRGETQSSYAEQEQANQIVTVVGPLTELMDPDTPGSSDNERSTSGEIVASDHVSPSPVGAKAVLLHKTFRVARIVQQPFVLPPHAFNPQLRGSYRGFAQEREPAADQPGSVQFLLLNEEQYASFVQGRPTEALLTADSSDECEINFRLPPSFEQSAKYHLVFRNNSASQQVVRADFQVEF
jgi:hypothetical protein